MSWALAVELSSELERIFVLLSFGCCLTKTQLKRNLNQTGNIYLVLWQISDLAGERVERGDVGVDQVHPGEAVTAMSGEEETTFRYRALATDHIVGHMLLL